ncbi:TPA: DUF3179 domain-containing protein, partial [Candidatus Woesearchaeota archaeon]|nr:DUF3179 domain-containing protein [Candidatus Woesearchaeota archaeon]
MKNKIIIVSIVVLSLCLVSCATGEAVKKSTEEVPNDGINRLQDGTKYIVHPDEIRGGGPPKDGIPSLDNPTYVSVQEADEWIEDNELALAIIYKGVKRVYPLQIMVWHEIVNDDIA